MTAIAQPCLFGREEPRVGEAAPTRIELTEGAWIDHAPGWLVGHQALFDDLLDRVDWKAHRRPMYDRMVDVPRLMGSMPSDGSAPGVVSDVQAVLRDRYGLDFDRVGLALYRDGRDSVAWHGDQVARELPQAFVATVSLGEPRPFALRPKRGGSRLDLRLGHGDLVVMGGTCQRTWEHCVPKLRRAGPRIALMLRPTATSNRPPLLT